MPLMAASVSTRVVFWKDAAEMNESVESEGAKDSMTRVFLLWLILGTGALCSAQQMGTVRGVVLDENGRRLAGATIVLTDINYRGLKPLIRRVEADTNGEFVLNDVSLATYSVDTQKESDGYTRPVMGIYRDHYENVITLSAAMPEGYATVRLGPRAGRIRPVAPVDAVSGKPVRSATVKLSRTVTREDGTTGEAYILTSANSDTLFVPARTAVTVLVSSSGYQDWYYPGVSDAAQATPLFLQPGDLISLNV